MQWFKHDSNASQDAKLKRLRMKYGLEGYGLYWYCIELVASGVDQNTFTFELEHDSEIIAFDTGIHVERVNEMMSYMVNLNLFESTNNTITCLKMLKRLDQSMTSSKKMREMINKAKGSHDAVMISHDSVMQEENRIDKNREDINFVFDQYNRIVKDLKPNWMKCSSVTDPRRKAIKRAMNQCSERAKELSVDESKYLVDLLGAMAEDAEFFSGHPNNTSKGFNCSFDTNFRQERISQAIDKFSGE